MKLAKFHGSVRERSEMRTATRPDAVPPLTLPTPCPEHSFTDIGQGFLVKPEDCGALSSNSKSAQATSKWRGLLSGCPEGFEVQRNSR
eukprot:7198108-Alexandrium_andersonii.AAC.1